MSDWPNDFYQQLLVMRTKFIISLLISTRDVLALLKSNSMQCYKNISHLT